MVRISREVDGWRDELIRLRRDLHAHPELGHQERRTQGLVLEILGQAGIEARALGGTGVAGLIQGREPGPVLLLRADLDALPIEEQTETDFRSRNAGIMHACGHDAHTAMLLVAARVLAAAPPARGAVRLMFQPAEEMGGGAEPMIRAGILDDPRVDGALAVHVWSKLPVGTIALGTGAIMASVDSFTLRLEGRGTHAAIPEEGIDPIAMAAQVIGAAQSLVSRRVPPHLAAVLSFTSIHGGTTFNVIPSAVDLKGTIRTFDSGVRELLRNELTELAVSIAGAMGGRAELGWTERLQELCNHPAMVGLAGRVAEGIVGAQRVVPMTPVMGGEDMALVLEKVPGAMVFLGCGNPAIGATFGHHHPRFAIDEDVLVIGAQLLVETSRRFCEGMPGEDQGSWTGPGSSIPETKLEPGRSQG